MEKQRAKDDQLAGLQVGSYEIEKRIPTGGYPLLYTGTDRVEKRPVLLYLLPPEFISENIAAADRLMVEARAASKVRHPLFPEILDVRESEGISYVAISPLEGMSLAAIMEKRKKLSVEESARIVLEAAKSMMVSHAAGVIHRELSPQTIFLSPEGEVIIARLGVPTFRPPFEAQDNLSGLDPAVFWSPQRFNQETIDGRADIFSLGLVFYYLLTHKTPFEGKYAEVLEKCRNATPIAPVQKLNPAVPKAFARIVHRMCAMRPDQRYQEIGALIGDLEGAINTAGAEVQAPPAPEVQALKETAQQWVSEAEVRFGRLRNRLAHKRELRLLGFLMGAILVALLVTSATVYLRGVQHRRAKAATERTLLAQKEADTLKEIQDIESIVGRSSSLDRLAPLFSRLDRWEQEAGKNDRSALARKMLEDRVRTAVKSLDIKARQLAGKGDLDGALAVYDRAASFKVPMIDTAIRLSKETLLKGSKKATQPIEAVVATEPAFDASPTISSRLVSLEPGSRAPNTIPAPEGGVLAIAETKYSKGYISSYQSAFALEGVGDAEGDFPWRYGNSGRNIGIFCGTQPFVFVRASLDVSKEGSDGSVKASLTEAKKVSILRIEEKFGSPENTIETSIELPKGSQTEVSFSVTYNAVLKNFKEGAVRPGIIFMKDALSEKRNVTASYRLSDRSLRREQNLAKALQGGHFRRFTVHGDMRDVTLDLVRWLAVAPTCPIKGNDSEDEIEFYSVLMAGSGLLPLDISLKQHPLQAAKTQSAADVKWPDVAWPDFPGMKVQKRWIASDGESVARGPVAIKWSSSAAEILMDGRLILRANFSGKDLTATFEDFGFEKCLIISRTQEPQRFEKFFFLDNMLVTYYSVWSESGKGKVRWEDKQDLNFIASGFGGWQSEECLMESDVGFRTKDLSNPGGFAVKWFKLKGNSLSAVVRVDHSDGLTGSVGMRVAGGDVVLSQESAVDLSDPLNSLTKMAISLQN